MTKSKSESNPSTNKTRQYHLLATKLYIPKPRPNLVPRLRLVEKLNEGMDRKLTRLKRFSSRTK